MTVCRRAFLTLGLLFSFTLLWCQNSEKDSLFRLVYADKAQQQNFYGTNFRRVTGNVDFFHNNAHFYCDSASWNVDMRIIEAFGNVKLVQGQSVLRSEQMLYSIDSNTAHFKGGVVELSNDNKDRLRTYVLDYNTKDSVGFFHSGGAMVDKDGNVIESIEGSFNQKENEFIFERNVEMYMDSIRIATTELRYLSDPQIAYFGKETNMWKGDSFMRADRGWYNRSSEIIYFADSVYMNDPQYESWTDEMFYDKITGEVNMYTSSQILDTAHTSYYIGDHIQYERDTIDGRITISEKPAVVFFGENENHQVDTLFFGAEKVLIYSVKKCDIDTLDINASEERLNDILFDTLKKRREEQAAEREKKLIERLREAGKLPPERPAADSTATGVPESDSLDFAVDSLLIDSLVVVPPLDTTHIRHLFAYNKVRAYRSDTQMVCDTLIFTGLDSIARLYGRPAIWNEVKNQITSQVMHFLLRNGNLYRGSMITDAWLISQQDSVYFNQIKCTEMMGYFHDNTLYRFDALGGVNAMFYMEEGEALTTVNVKEAKSMSAMIKDGNAQRMLYMETIKSDAYPILQLEVEKHRLKDFEWRGQERPVTRFDITDVGLKDTERERFIQIRQPLYPETNRFFDEYMFHKLNPSTKEE